MVSFIPGDSKYLSAENKVDYEKLWWVNETGEGLTAEEVDHYRGYLDVIATAKAVDLGITKELFLQTADGQRINLRHADPAPTSSHSWSCLKIGVIAGAVTFAAGIALIVASLILGWPLSILYIGAFIAGLPCGAAGAFYCLNPNPCDEVKALCV